MSLTDYNGLLQSIEDWSKRDDVANVIPDFIVLAEKEIDKSLELHDNEKRATVVLNTDDRFVKLPSDYLQIRSLRVVDGANYYDMVYAPPEGLALSRIAGRPYYFTVNSKIEFDKIPDKSYTIEMTYYSTLVPLSESNTTNNVLTRYPDIYLYGALSALHRWARDEETAQYYQNLFYDRVATANKQERKSRYGSAPAMKYEGFAP